MRGHGRRKVMFGTNYPMIPAAKALEGLDDLGLDADAKASFLGGNVARVFRINQLARLAGVRAVGIAPSYCR